MKASELSGHFAAGLDYDSYVQTGTEEQQRRWKQVYESAKLTEEQSALIASFTRRMNLLTISGVWCGDCIQQIPLLHRIVQANPKMIEHRLVDRDQRRELSAGFLINAGDRVPVVLFLAEDFEFCGAYGDRTLNRYRAVATRQLGASCRTGIAPQDQTEMSATLQDWVNEVERIQLMLRISPRLRQKNGD